MSQWLGIFFQENLTTIIKLSNILKNEKSPYLQQHKDNPVDWFPWNKETLDKAKKEKKTYIFKCRVRKLPLVSCYGP